MGFFDDTIGTIGKSLAKSATDYLTETTGYDVGGTLAFLFGDGQTSKGGTLDGLVTDISKEFSGAPDALALLQNSLNDQTEEINRLGTQLTALATAVQDIAGEIKGLENLLQKIGQEQLYLSWQQQDNQIKVFIGKIDSTYQDYAETVAQDASVDDVKEIVASILDPNEGEVNACVEINSFMLSDQQNKGALQLWAEMVCPVIESGLLDYRQAVDQYFAYYTKLTWAQLRATNLVMEARHFNQDNELAKTAWSDYQNLLLTQEDEFIGNLVRLIRSGLAGSVVPSNSYNLTAYHAAAQFHPDLMAIMNNGSFVGAYYEPSAVLKRGEAFLARLAVTDPDQRRMVVHLTFFGDAFKTAIDAATITLDLVSSHHKTRDHHKHKKALAPTRDAAVYGPLASPVTGAGNVPDDAWITDPTFYVKRMVFEGSTDSGFTDGFYRLTNLNGQGSLQPMGTYFGTVPFQTDAVLGYTMDVNDTQVFDYMNFAGYFANHYSQRDKRRENRPTHETSALRQP